MLKDRVLTALVLLAGFVAALFLLPSAGWLAVVAIITAAGAREWGRLEGLSPATCGLFALGVASALIAIDLFAVPILWLLKAGVVFWLLPAPLWLARGWRLRGAPGALLGAALLLTAGIALLQLRQLSPLVLLSLMALIWVADSAAYFSGRAWGRHKLAPAISPGKTWEGAAGAVLGVVLIGVLLSHALRAAGLPALHGFWLLPQLLLITALSIIGDLFESMLKRQAGIKDSGRLLPGHGGVLDRIDSLLPTLPLGYLLLHYSNA